MDPGAVRIDKWLWAVRLYKSRTMAGAACTGGHVKMSEQPVKPSRGVRIGEVITAVTGDITRTVKVIGLLERRVGAKLVSQYLEDLTPASEYNKQREKHFLPPPVIRPKGMGRPTKKERRNLEKLME
jgi:ribosome-associated heat shock protein Hsp15